MERASPRNQHNANCIGTLSFPKLIQSALSKNATATVAEKVHLKDIQYWAIIFCPKFSFYWITA